MQKMIVANDVLIKLLLNHLVWIQTASLHHVSIMCRRVAKLSIDLSLCILKLSSMCAFFVSIQNIWKRKCRLLLRMIKLPPQLPLATPSTIHPRTFSIDDS
mmetsp:Transcript_6666/g.11838  ORF Transcript_6666/g.11838 Transcript_6666/m.11838 type:complete len:101 (+) Transcript_6666:48-350(+)